MTRNWRGLLFVLLLAATFSACGGKRITVEIPPQIDLAAQGTIGVIAFAVESDKPVPGDITLNFIQHMQAAQPGVPILELGNQTDVLHEVGFNTLDPEAVKAIGRKYGVDSLLTGTLEVSHSPPDVKVGHDLTSVSAASYVRGSLNARLRRTGTSATVWSNGAYGKWKLANLDIAAGSLTSINMKNLEDRYNKMVRELSRTATADFRRSYETRVVHE